MKTYLECVACLVKQSVDAVKVATQDDELRMSVLHAVLREASQLDYGAPPPVMGGRIHRVIREETGNPDPYKELKSLCNRLALERLPDLRKRVKASKDPFDTALRLAMAGNVLDFSILEAEDDIPLDDAVKDALTQSLGVDDTGLLRDALEKADRILYLADNAGEIVFDRLLLELLPADRVAVSVKGGPVINDATLEDAEEAGLTASWKVITTGSRFPGVIISDCSDSFRKRFEEADVVVAKGQANYETLESAPKRVFHLMRAKCPTVSRDLGVPVGSWIVKRS